MIQDPGGKSEIIYKAGLLLVFSNVFMTFAWYAHLRNLADRPWWIAVGYTMLSLAQLKILQEVIALMVFVPFAVLYLREPIKLDYLWAALCLVGAVYFVFRSH